MDPNDEEVPYRSGIPGLVIQPEEDTTTADEEQYSTLEAITLSLRQSVKDLDNISAFELTGSELSIKQQVKAHQMAYAILAPMLAACEGALVEVNSKYKER